MDYLPAGRLFAKLSICRQIVGNLKGKTMQRKVDVSARLADGTKVHLTAHWLGGEYIDIYPHAHPLLAVDTVNVFDYATGSIRDEYADLLKGSATYEQFKAIRDAVREHVSEYRLSDWVNYLEAVGVRA